MDERLSRIDTMWSMVQRAHRQDATEFAKAQQQMIDRYGGAVRRYAMAALRDPEAADEVYQEFALKFVRGDYGKADPAKGRFRSFLKTSLYHLIVDFQRRRGRQQQQATPLVDDTPDDVESYQAPDDQEFINSWRANLLGRVWQQLEREELTTGKPYHTVLRARVEHPDVRSPELAKLVSDLLHKEMNAGAVRVMLHRAREKFGDLLIDEVANTLSDASAEAVEEELIELDLWQYCKPALERRSEQSEQ
ncbi:RNA polymerase sigma factor [Aeoliella mucimassa]|uniref:RNA polymerase sigma factor n=1 Tax=Aeoliella mucimassa TaxID=2527972 RepID=A0A518AWM2_9BACT|nr:sigma-70 family RNA polymerase sigma factor [Aeoliella mucimassa]QDU59124.1 RNA polymerase sigma factor [Aeoliella mucimassa]